MWTAKILIRLRDAQAALSLLLHKTYCRFCRALAHFMFNHKESCVAKLTPGTAVKCIINCTVKPRIMFILMRISTDEVDDPYVYQKHTNNLVTHWLQASNYLK